MHVAKKLINKKQVYKKWWFWLIVLIAGITLAYMIIGSFFLSSFRMVGPSMEDTIFAGDSVTVSNNSNYNPTRGDIVVFENPQHGEEFVIKRVVAIVGDTVDINDCDIKVYNSENPNGFDPYQDFDVSNPNDCVSGAVNNYTVPNYEIFVIGDHRNGSYSHDSRSGIGNDDSSNTNPAAISSSNVIGPVIDIRFNQ